MKNKKQMVQDYFEMQNQSDAAGVAALFTEDAEVYNVNFPKFSGQIGIKGFCENLYARTLNRDFQIIDILENSDYAMVEWKVKMTFKKGAQIGPFELDNSFDVDLRGMTRFDFDRSTNLINCLRIYHETSTVGQLAQENAVKTSVV